MSALYPLQDPLSRGVYLPTTMAFRGTWNATTQYYPNETVVSPTDQDLYLTTIPISGGADPSTGIATWLNLSGGPAETVVSVGVPGAPVNITTDGTVNPIALTGAPVLVPGALYDIQVIGVWAIPAGVVGPGATNRAEIILSCGGVAPTQTAIDNQYPAFVNRPWTTPFNADVKIRARLTAGAGPLALAGSVFSAPGVFPGDVCPFQALSLTINRVD